jgi:hypothetical protein
MKRRHSVAPESNRPPKKRKVELSLQHHDSHPVDHPVLSCYYDCLVTLRDYIVARLGQREKTRKNAKLFKCFLRNVDTISANDHQFNVLLDSVLVGFNHNTKSRHVSTRMHDFAVFSQSFPQTNTSTIGRDSEPNDELQIEVGSIQLSDIQ